MDRVNVGRVSRVAPLVGLAGRTAGEAVVASMRNRRRGVQSAAEFHSRNAQRYAEQLGWSRGVLMKAGQILSVLLPESAEGDDYRGIYQAAFAKLQDDAPPMPAHLPSEIITAELGCSPSELFVEFDPQPLAAASIGQVHLATLSDGRRVAVKVQYPGVDEAIRADLKNTALLTTFLRLLLSSMPNLAKVDLRAMTQEIAERIGEEIDYQVEAANQQLFADAYRGHPFIRIPEVLPELTSRRVLAMEFVEGLRYSEAVRAEQSLRDRWGEVIFRFVVGSLHSLGAVNTDPHPGNYVFHRDGTVSFLDFGCVRRMSRDQAATLERFIQLTSERNPGGLYDWGVESGWIDPGDSLTPDELLAWWSEGYKYLLPPQPFTFTPSYAVEAVRNRLSATSPHLRVTRKLAVPREHVLQSRVDTGMNAVLGGLHATAPWNAIRAEYHSDCASTTLYGEWETEFRRTRR
jgi:predicted unusual protein kinase regulating ubiquinone biosynthesis (AarF/ABC1/UbiB family)